MVGQRWLQLWIVMIPWWFDESWNSIGCRWMQLYIVISLSFYQRCGICILMYIEIGSGSFASMWFWFCLCMFVLNAPCWLKSWRWSARSTRFRATRVAVRLGRKLLARLIDVERGCLGRAERIWGIKSRPARNQSKVQQCQPNSTEANWVKSRQLLSAVCLSKSVVLSCLTENKVAVNKQTNHNQSLFSTNSTNPCCLGWRVALRCLGPGHQGTFFWSRNGWNPAIPRQHSGWMPSKRIRQDRWNKLNLQNKFQTIPKSSWRVASWC